MQRRERVLSRRDVRGARRGRRARRAGCSPFRPARDCNGSEQSDAAMRRLPAGPGRVRAIASDHQRHAVRRRRALVARRSAAVAVHARLSAPPLMKLGRIVGTVVASRKDASLDSLKLLIVVNLSTTLEREGGYVVAVDSVGAGVGEVILYATGSSARQTAVTKDRPVDAVIMAIVDSFDIEGRSTRLA